MNLIKLTETYPNVRSVVSLSFFIYIITLDYYKFVKHIQSLLENNGLLHKAKFK